MTRLKARGGNLPFNTPNGAICTRPHNLHIVRENEAVHGLDNTSKSEYQKNSEIVGIENKFTFLILFRDTQFWQRAHPSRYHLRAQQRQGGLAKGQLHRGWACGGGM